MAGVALGNLGNAAGASVGLAAIFAVSAAAFAAVKYVGALYLIYLGFKTLRAAHDVETKPASPSSSEPWRIFREGLIVSLFNPKTAVFFAAFLPQFLETGSTPLLQSLLLGTLFVAIAAMTDTIYALTAGAIAPALTRGGSLRALGRYAAGGAFIGLGLLAALAGTRSGK